LGKRFFNLQPFDGMPPLSAVGWETLFLISEKPYLGWRHESGVRTRNGQRSALRLLWEFWAKVSAVESKPKENAPELDYSSFDFDGKLRQEPWDLQTLGPTGLDVSY
jgi:hypothetical protein